MLNDQLADFREEVLANPRLRETLPVRNAERSFGGLTTGFVRCTALRAWVYEMLRWQAWWTIEEARLVVGLMQRLLPSFTRDTRV